MPEEAGASERVEHIRRAMEAFNRRDVEAWLSFYSPEIVYLSVPMFTDSQERRGLDAMRRWMEEWYEVWADDYSTAVGASRSTATS